VKIMEITGQDWGRIIDVNLSGVLYLSQAFIPHMRERKAGSIVCMSSDSAQRGGGIFGGPHYSAAKQGVLGLACDVANRTACQAAADEVIAQAGQIDVLVNNAGISQPLKLMEIEAANYDAVTDVNLRGTLYMSQAVIPAMRRQRTGAIVCMSSVSAQRGGGIFGGPHYSAAKAGVLGLAKAMARELGSDGIRVNSVTPGLIQTDITAGKLTDAMRAEIVSGIPLGRLGVADDVANVCLFLASDLSAYLTGAVIDVNGGMLIH
jgi:NAD(P)-dependent dehydrogenase (short-subunit alcohol dehydrogenase family)